MPVSGQSLYLGGGQRAIEVSGAWSVGPSSRGGEALASVGLDGRWDIGLRFGRYTLTFDDGSTSTFDEYAPFVRFFAIKQQDGGSPVSLDVSGQVFVDDYGTRDSGGYVQIGTAIYKDLTLSGRVSIQPFMGFGLVAESYTFDGGPAERAQYLTRDLGLHVTTPPTRPWLLRVTLAEQSFRRETYRGARVSVIRRF